MVLRCNFLHIFIIEQIPKSPSKDPSPIQSHKGQVYNFQNKVAHYFDDQQLQIFKKANIIKNKNKIKKDTIVACDD